MRQQGDKFVTIITIPNQSLPPSFFKRMILPKRIFQIFGSFFLILLLYGAYLGVLYFTGNFHSVVDGQIYRSAQITPSQLQRYQQQYGIRTIINLRGANRGSVWYDQEVAAAKDLGITHIDFRMSARRILPQEKVVEVINLIKNAQKPVLIHCKSGADRTGLISALSVAVFANGSEEDAESELSFRYGHIGIPFLSASYRMDETWESLEKWLGMKGS